MAEQGKPRNEAFSMEVLPTIDALRWIAAPAPRSSPTRRSAMPQLFLKTKRSAFTYEPLGVVGIISPWNYPWTIPFGEVAIALMAGNGVVLKPASLTPLIGERIQRMFERAGVPEGLVRVVHGPGTGAALVESDVAKVFFTGSVETGRSVGEACARAVEGLACSSSAARTRCSCSPTPTSSTRSPARCGAASPTPARPARGSSAST